MELLERYRPLFLIGRGGMGTIEVAVERGSLSGGVVALKRMLPGVRDHRHVDMFMREARLATLLNHENVVHAFAFGERDGELFIAMEYVEGQTLASLCSALASRGERLPVQLIAYILAALCEGLHAAHELRDVGGKALGVVHRDVSPHNVMLSYGGEVKLLDFGVAKLDNAANLTKTGEVKGKTAYMSPEQAMGEKLDRRSDLYGVGAILFELMAGHRMWTGESDLELLRQLALAEAPRLGDVVPDAPRELADLQARLVAKKPKDRPVDAREVAGLFRTLLKDSVLPPSAALAMLLDVHFGEHKRTKQQQLETALSRDGSEEEPVTAPASKARAAPWMYALVGAAVASVAVIGLARNRPPLESPSTVAASAPSMKAPDPTPAVSALVSQPVQAQDTHTAQPTVPTFRVGHPVPTHTRPSPTTSAPPPVHPPLDVDPHAI
jgi:eukaryotic-like serine/threonine-protein kinase